MYAIMSSVRKHPDSYFVSTVLAILFLSYFYVTNIKTLTEFMYYLIPLIIVMLQLTLMWCCVDLGSKHFKKYSNWSPRREK